MGDIPVTEAVAEYRGRRIPIAFSGDDWVALRVDPGATLPDGFASGESRSGEGHYEAWVKVRRSAVEGIVHVLVSATVAGHKVSVRRWLANGRVGVEFVGNPSDAKSLRLTGDQHTGWTGVFDASDLKDICVEEVRRD